MTQPTWGGDWTKTKLQILSAYLDRYTTVLKGQPFNLWYIDAFAGTGTVELEGAGEDARQFLDGSAKLALDVRARAFDRFVFIEKKRSRTKGLAGLPRLPSQEVSIHEGDANREVRELCASTDWRRTRAVAFIDPFATQTGWATVEAVAETQAIDTWILFPVFAIRRILPRSALPEQTSADWAANLTRVFGDKSWRDLYSAAAQLPMFGERGVETERGVAGIVSLYRSKLETVFPHVAPQSRRLVNSQDSPLFEFMFAAGNPRGGEIAVRIATHLLRTM